MRYLTLREVVDLHQAILERTGGLAGIRDVGALHSALAQPKVSFGGTELHLTLVDKAAALCVSVVQNHPFLDGNKRVGHAAMETFLLLNGLEIEATVDEQERAMLDVAAGAWGRPELANWLRDHVRPVA